MLIDVDDATAMHLEGALILYWPVLERACRRNGVEVPPGVAAFAEQLERVRVGDMNPDEKAAKLNAERCSRWRARKRGEVVPLRRPGPAPRLAG